MSCFGCSRKYGLFCKEIGCPNCGYSYCAKCLQRPMAVPRHGGKLANVCLICYDRLSKKQRSGNVVDVDVAAEMVHSVSSKGEQHRTTQMKATAASIFEDDPPPDLGAVLLPSSPKLQPYAISTSADLKMNKEYVENLDSSIAKRLRDLKSVGLSSTDNELRSRLDNLKGAPSKEYSKKELLPSADQRSDQEKINDLLQQFMGENELTQKMEEESHDAISDIERRLKALRNDPIEDQGASERHTTKSVPLADTDEKAMLADIIAKYLSEARSTSKTSDDLDEVLTPDALQAGDGADTAELPWCTVCNEDAVYRCKSCDGDLYCAQCFREIHDDEEYRAHTKTNYSSSSKYKEDHFQ